MATQPIPDLSFYSLSLEQVASKAAANKSLSVDEEQAVR